MGVSFPFDGGTIHRQLNGPGFGGIGNTPAALPYGLFSPHTRTIWVDSGGRGNFTTIIDAINYVLSQNPTFYTSWTIWVVDGYSNYIEPAFAVPPYTNLYSTALLPPSPGLTDNLYPNICFFTTSWGGFTDTLNGALITLSVGSAVAGFYLFTNQIPLVGDSQIIKTTNVVTGGNVIYIAFVPLLDNNGHKLDYISGPFIVADTCIFGGSVTQPSNTVCVHATSTRSGVYRSIFNASCQDHIKIETGNNQNQISFTRFTPGLALGYDINCALGSAQVNNSPYKKAFGTIDHVDRWFPSIAAIREAPSVIDTPTISKGAVGQTADLSQEVDSANIVQHAIGPTGQQKTNQIVAATTPGTIVGKEPVYDTAGNLKGYRPIYDAIT